MASINHWRIRLRPVGVLMEISVATRVVKIIGLTAMLIPAILTAAPAPLNHYFIGTGSPGATFYPMIDALCRQISHSALGFTCEAVATPGSEYNLRGLEEGKLDLAMSQANLQYLASQGMPPFSKAHEHIRTVAPLHQEIFILAVRGDSGISQLSDLKGRRINIGNAGSGSRLITEYLFEFLGWELSQFEIHGSKSADLPELFCGGKIDAAIYSTGHPNSIYRQLIEQCGVSLVDFWSEDVARFVALNREYRPAEISRNTYAGIAEAKHGFGVQVLLSAQSKLPPEHIAGIMRTLDKHRDALAEMAPIFRTVNVAATTGQQVAPYHNGAQLYLQQQR